MDQDEFDFWTHDLDSVPGNPFHSEFRLRFRTEVTASNDDWFIDDVFVGLPPSCPWDLDGNGSVGASDLLVLLVAWGPNPGHPADFDGDGAVGATDLLALLVNWGPCP